MTEDDPSGLSDFQRGIDLGRAAAELSFEDLPTGSVETKIGFAQGYGSGLQQFVLEHSNDIRDYSSKLFLLNHPDTTFLLWSAGLDGYNNGLHRRFIGSSREELIRKEPDHEDLDRNSVVRSLGYQTGFLVGILKDFGMIPKHFRLPVNEVEFEVFTKGLRGETFPYSIGPDIQDMLNNMQYCSGLEIWLHSQGVNGVSISDIRMPAHFEAFKAGLEGRDRPPTTEDGEDLDGDGILAAIEEDFMIEQAYDLGRRIFEERKE